MQYGCSQKSICLSNSSFSKLEKMLYYIISLPTDSHSYSARPLLRYLSNFSCLSSGFFPPGAKENVIQFRALNFLLCCGSLYPTLSGILCSISVFETMKGQSSKAKHGLPSIIVLLIPEVRELLKVGNRSSRQWTTANE